MGGFPMRAAGIVIAVLALLAAGCGRAAQVREDQNVGGLVFAVIPPDAEVVLDGVLRGQAAAFTGERYLAAGPGTHRLELRKPGYEPYLRDVYVPNALLRIEAVLMPGGSAPGDS